jgi:hypothetical protein
MLNGKEISNTIIEKIKEKLKEEVSLITLEEKEKRIADYDKNNIIIKFINNLLQESYRLGSNKTDLGSSSLKSNIYLWQELDQNLPGGNFDVILKLKGDNEINNNYLHKYIYGGEIENNGETVVLNPHLPGGDELNLIGKDIQELFTTQVTKELNERIKKELGENN